MTTLLDVTTTSPLKRHSFIHTRRRVAKILLERTTDGASGRPHVAQRDIAIAVGTDWGTVHMSLKSLRDAGVIRIDRHRLIINKELLQKFAGT